MLFNFNACQHHAFRKSKIVFLGLIKSRQKKLKFGQTWVNVGQTFGIICFLNFEFGVLVKKYIQKFIFLFVTLPEVGKRN